LWLVRTVDGRTVYGALPGAMLDRLWSQFPACLADAFELRGPYGRSVRLRSAEATATERVLRSAGNTGLALGVGATDASLRAEWWAIVWPGAVFFGLVALVVEGAMRGFERRARDLYTKVGPGFQAVV
jgi:hypothetical protein